MWYNTLGGDHNMVEITVHGGTLSDAEKKAYVDWATSKYGVIPVSLDIKLDGDKVSFVENGSYQDMPLRITYAGTFSSADEIKFTRVVVEGTPEEAVAKRSK
jgi:hypothetical protein